MSRIAKVLSSVALFCLVVLFPSAAQSQSPTGIYGAVRMGSPGFSEEEWARLEEAAGKSFDEFRKTLTDIDRKGTPPVVNVYAVSSRKTYTVKSATDGRFAFEDISRNVYTVYAQSDENAPGEDRPRLASPRYRVRAVENNPWLYPQLYPELLSVKGRVVDTDGNPMADVKVTGTLTPIPEAGEIQSFTTVTDTDGNYVISDLEPIDNPHRIAGYLNGGSLKTVTDLQTHVEITVKAEGYEQPKDQIPEVPLLMERYVKEGRRYLEIMKKVTARLNPGKENEIEEKANVSLPEFEGNAITGVDVVMSPVEE